MNKQDRCYFDQTEKPPQEELPKDNMAFTKPYNADNQFHIRARGLAQSVVNITPGTIKVFKVESTS